MFCTAAPAFALDGRVLDLRSGNPIANAEISILGRPGSTRTDTEGRFSWTPDPAPPFEVLVVLPGGRVLKPVLVETLNQGQPLVLRVTTLVEEAVTVIGSAPSIEAPAASGTSMMTARDLQTRQPITLVQALETTPGVSTVSEGHAAVPAIRGLARGRTLILLDGGRVTSERRVGPSATFLDPFLVEAIEVARGPGSIAYGSDALGGVIYARTRRPEANAPFAGRAVLSGGAGIPQARAGAEVSKGFSNGGVLLLGHYRDLNDYRSPQGTIGNSGARDGGILGRVEQRAAGGLFSFGWESDFGRDIGRPRNNSNLTRFYYPDETSHRLTGSYDTRNVGGFHRLLLSTFIGRSRLVTDQDRLPTSRQPRNIERADVGANDFQVRGVLERHVSSVKLEFGGEVLGRYGLHATDSTLAFDMSGAQTNETTNISVDDARRTDTGGYISLEAALQRALVVSGGARIDQVTTRNTGGYFGDRHTSNHALSGALSLTAGPHRGWSVTGQVARGFRDPLLSDRYYRGPSGRGFITGEPGLSPETSLQWDAAIRYTGARWRTAVYAYRYTIDDLIERYEGTPDNFFYRNRGRARIRGFELEGQATLAPGWIVEVLGQVARGVALDDGASLDDIPASTFSAVLRRELTGGAFAQVRGAAFGRDTHPGPTERVMPGYFLLDVAGGLPLTGNLELQVNGRNLLDAEYLSSPDPRAVLAPGASVLVSAIARF